MTLRISDFREHDATLGTAVYVPDTEAEKDAAIAAVEAADGWFLHAVTSASGSNGAEVIARIRPDAEYVEPLTET